MKGEKTSVHSPLTGLCTSRFEEIVYLLFNSPFNDKSMHKCRSGMANKGN